MSNRTHIVRTQKWQRSHCFQKPVADNQMAPMLDKISPGVHQYLLRILQWNANCIHPLLDDRLEATNVDVVCIQETKLRPKDKTPELINFSAVQCDRPVQGKW